VYVCVCVCVCVCVSDVSVRLSVCVSVCPRSYLRNYTSDLHQFFGVCVCVDTDWER